MNSKRQRVGLKIFLSFAAALYLALRFSPYPELKKFCAHSYSTRIYDCNGRLLQVLSLEDGLRREWTDYKQFPKSIRKIFLKAEDKHFFVHYGVDFAAVVKAFFQNKASGRTVRGASTITMQLVRIIEPIPQNQKRTIKTKFLDSVNALRLEARLSKKKILELYLNNVPFGTNCEGVTSAARTIYSKNLEDLTESEIYCLAVIPRRPSDNNPLINPQNCLEKAQQLHLFVTGKPIEAPAKTARYIYPKEMPHLVQYIQSEFDRQKTPYPAELHLSADLELYNYAQNLARQALNGAEASRISNASVLVLDNEDNSVLAWIGNADWYDSEHSGQVDGVLVKNQMGSSMKPFLYALGLETKYKPSDILSDVPKEFGSSNVYIPANFNNRFNGPVRYRVALASSLNVPAVTLLSEIGVENYLQTLEKLGFESLKQNGAGAELGLALGAGEVSLKELVTAFSVFVRDGKYLPLVVENRKTKNVTKTKIQTKTEPVKVFKPDTARIICAFLSDKSARAKGFGYEQSFETTYPSIFKTGTSNQFQDIVALGATRRWTVGVWMGNFSGETVIGKTGSSLPAATARQILDYLMGSLEHPENEKFAQPENYELVPVCAVSGMEPGPYCSSIVYEYAQKEGTRSMCSWHKADGSVDYPSEYQQWFRLANRNGRIDYNDTRLYVLTPNDNSVFFYDVTKKDKLAINVEASGVESVLTVEYDGAFFIAVERPFVFALPMERGNHQVVLKCGNENETFCYEVR